MNLFKRLLFNKNPRRLPAVRPGQAAMWNQDGSWMQDIGNGPTPFFETSSGGAADADAGKVVIFGSNGGLYCAVTSGNAGSFLAATGAVALQTTCSNATSKLLRMTSLDIGGVGGVETMELLGSGAWNIGATIVTQLLFALGIPTYADETAANAAEAVDVVYMNTATGKIQRTTA